MLWSSLVETNFLHTVLRILVQYGIPFLLLIRPQLADLFRNLVELLWLQQPKVPFEFKLFF